MSIEKRVFVRMPEGLSAHVLDLAARGRTALSRAKKLPSGDRTEAVRFESLHAAIDQLAIAAIANGELHEVLSPVTVGDDIAGPSVFGPGLPRPEGVTCLITQWLQAGSVVVELRLPHFPGTTHLSGRPGLGPPAPAT